MTVETEDPTGKLYEPVDWKTGSKMPARPLMPDNGFSRNVGEEWMESTPRQELEEKLFDLPLSDLLVKLKETFKRALSL